MSPWENIELPPFDPVSPKLNFTTLTSETGLWSFELLFRLTLTALAMALAGTRRNAPSARAPQSVNDLETVLTFISLPPAWTSEEQQPKTNLLAVSQTKYKTATGTVAIWMPKQISSLQKSYMKWWTGISQRDAADVQSLALGTSTIMGAQGLLKQALASCCEGSLSAE